MQESNTVESNIQESSENALSSESLETTNINNEITQESTLYAEPIFNIGNFTVTNALFTSWIVVILLIIFSIKIKTKIKKIPKGIQNLFEIIIEGAESLCDQITNSRKITEKAFPIVMPVFLFILINNWVGVLPLGGFGLIEDNTFIPFIRSGTADINTTLALAILSVIGANIFGILTVGAWKTLNKYVNLRALGSIFTKIKKDPTVIMTAPIMFAVGFIEFIGEIAKIASLSFRLFGNVFAGEVLLASMGAILAYILPTPFMLLEVFVGAIQAFIFAMLTLVYYTVASLDEEGEEEHENKKEIELEKVN